MMDSMFKSGSSSLGLALASRKLLRFYGVVYVRFQERKERLKKEGKFLTKTQKQQRAHTQAMLDSMKKQGTNCDSVSVGLRTEMCILRKCKHHLSQNTD